MAYSQEQKEIAVGIVARFGGMTNEALTMIRNALDAPGLSKSTVHGWVMQSDVKLGAMPKHPTPAKPNRTEPEPRKSRTEPTEPKKIVPSEQTERTLDEMFESVARTYLNHAEKKGVVDDTKGKDAVMAAAIAVDKMRLMRGLPTAIVQLLPVIIAKIESMGLKASDYFEAMLQELADADGADSARVDQEDA